MKIKKAILMIMSASLVSCVPVKNLQSISAHDGARGSLFYIKASGNEAQIMTRDTLRDHFTIKSYTFGEKERSDIERILTTYGFPSLREYYEPIFGDVCDGETLDLEVVYDGKKKSVFCNNSIPWRANRICAETIYYFESKTPNKSWRTNRP